LRAFKRRPGCVTTARKSSSFIDVRQPVRHETPSAAADLRRVIWPAWLNVDPLASDAAGAWLSQAMHIIGD
jgi:hypothetical protein